MQRFRAWVEQRFRSQPALAALAHELGITPTQLNRVCHQVLGHSALGVLRGRLVLEAQRDLAFTTQSVKQIGATLTAAARESISTTSAAWVWRRISAASASRIKGCSSMTKMLMNSG